MMDENNEKAQRQRKPRRKMTAQEKKTAAKKRAEAKTENMKPVVCVQYQDREADVYALVETAKAVFREENKRVLITDLKLYVKPEEGAAYYVINETFSGKLEF